MTSGDKRRAREADCQRGQGKDMEEEEEGEGEEDSHALTAWILKEQPTYCLPQNLALQFGQSWGDHRDEKMETNQ